MICKVCNKDIYNTDDNLCTKCRADKITDVCKINKFGYKKIKYTTMAMAIPYCFKDKKEVLIGNMEWLCDNCQHGKRGE